MAEADGNSRPHPTYIVVCTPTIYVGTEVRESQPKLTDAKIGQKTALETAIYAKQVRNFWMNPRKILRHPLNFQKNVSEPLEILFFTKLTVFRVVDKFAAA